MADPSYSLFDPFGGAGTTPVSAAAPAARQGIQ
jgi:hypothetical protein